MPSLVWIVGGGLVGCGLALELANQGMAVHILDPSPPSGKLGGDLRAFALSFRSCQWLSRFLFWETLPKTPIREVKVWCQGQSGVISYPELDPGTPLGYMVPSAYLRQKIRQEAWDHPLITWHAYGGQHCDFVRTPQGYAIQTPEGRWSAQMLVGADGRGSYLGRHVFKTSFLCHAYPQQALLFTLKHSVSHDYQSLECFYPKGSLALLPLEKQGEFYSSVVWIDVPDKIQSFQRSSDKDLIKIIQSFEVPFLEEGLQIIPPYQVYDLSLRLASPFIFPHGVLLGDSAHTLHPIAGQGLNIGFGDGEVLAQCLIKRYRQGLPLGGKDCLRAYGRERRKAIWEMAAFTHGVVGALSLFPGRRVLWPLGMGLFQGGSWSDFWKRKMTRRAMGLD